MIASIPSAVLLGVDGRPVSVEVHVANGLPGLTIVGLPDAAVRESRDRVRAALISSGLAWPRRRITVNLAPSGMRKAGAGLDLPIAIGVLVASGVVDPSCVAGVAFVGELGLDGSVRSVPGTMVLADALVDRPLVVADAGLREARLAGGECRSAPTLAELVARCAGRRPWVDPPASVTEPAGTAAGPDPVGDLSEVIGQPVARRALEVAATGRHHLLMVGPPGAGKTLLATRVPGLLPDLDARHGQGRHPHPLRRRSTGIRSRPGDPSTVPGPPPRHLDRGPGRWRQRGHAPGGDRPGARGDAVPRRIG